MKTTLTILLIALCVSVSGQIREPLRHYSFDDAGAATGLEDSSGNGATLKMYGNPTFSTTLKAAGSSSISLDGTGDMLTIPTTNLTNEFFVSFWARTNTDITAHRYFFAKAGANAFQFLGMATNNVLASSYISSTNNTSGNASWTKETWHHIIVYYNDGGSSTKVRIYLDGSKLTLTDSLIATGIDVNDSIYIGANLNRGGLFTGQIDELRIYSGFAPSQSQRDSLRYKTYIGTPGSGSGYNPIIGRHVRFSANGIEKKDKGRDGTFQYWLAKKQAVATYTQVDLAQDRTYILSGYAQDYDWVGELQASRSWRIHEGGTIFYTYNINEDTSELFGISSNVIYCKDVSAMQASKTYAITYSVYDGYFYDVAKMYIYKPPADSCVTVTNWTGYDNNFQTGYYYFQPRGSTTTVLSQIDINVNDVHFGAIGTGNLPVLNKGWTSTVTDGIFYASNKTGITFQSMQFDPNGYGGSIYAAAIYASIATNVRINNCSFVGDIAGNDLWAYPARLEKTVSLLFSNNAVSGAVFDGLYVTGCEVGNIINNRVANVNSNTIHNNGDIFNLRTPPNTAGSFTIRHNYGNKSTFSGKSIVSLLKPGTASPSGNDTLEMNYFVGYAQTGEVATSEGTTLFNFAGVDNAVIRYNVAEDCSRGLYTTSYNVSIDGTSYTCAGNENNKMYYNLFKNIYILPVQLNNLSNGTQIYNNTFAGYGTSWYTGFTAVKGAIATGGFDVDVINNVFAQSGVEPYYGSEGTGTIDYNIYSDAGSHTLGSQELEANPLLNSDYTLHTGSPAINEGTTTISGGLGFDLKRMTVPQDALYDMGCYEGAYNGELLGDTGGEVDLPDFNIAGINKQLTDQDYDGVCPTGETWETDCDCAVNYFSRAPLRAIADVTDFANIKYIDFTDTGSTEAGTITEPYNSWDDWTWAANTAYLFKRGTVSVTTSERTINANNVLLGTYGTGDTAIIRGAHVGNTISLDGTGNMYTVRDLKLEAPAAYDNIIATNVRNSSCAINIGKTLGDSYVKVDMYGCQVYHSPFGLRCAYPVAELRVINCDLHKTATEGAYPQGNYVEFRHTRIYDINRWAITQPEIDINGGTNNGSTGDGIEILNWNQLLIANCLIDHGSTPNKGTIMLHSDNGIWDQEAKIIAYNVLVGPENGTTSVQTINQSTSAKGLLLKGNLIFESQNNNNEAVGFWNGSAGADTVINNVFVGYGIAVYQAAIDNSLYDNNTFYDNTNCVYASPAKTIPSFRNNITYNNSNVFTNVTATLNSNNVSGNPSFVNPTLNHTTADFSLQSGSSAINAGATIDYVPIDIEGNPRVSGQYDAGAYEYQGESSIVNVCLVGNSIMGPIHNLFITDGDPYIFTNIAHSGDGILKQTDAWDALTTTKKQSFDCVLLEVGINSVGPGAVYHVSYYQTLINHIKADVRPDCIIVAATITVGNGSAGVDLTHWLELNAAIRGEGPAPITGITRVMTTNTTDLDANGDYFLDAPYNISVGNVHPNTAGTAVMKANFLYELQQP